MADRKTTERQIQQKLKELDALRKDLEDARRRLEAKYAQKEKELQARYDKEVARIHQQARKDAAVEIEKLLNNLENELLALTSSKLSKMEELFEEKTKRQEELIQELEEEYGILKKEFEAYIYSKNEERSKKKIYALEAKRGTLISQAQIENSAHGFFFPRQKAIIDGSMSAAQTSFNSEMYEAAAAELNNIRLSYDLLAARVAQATDDWAQSFVTYCSIVNQLHRKLNEFRRKPIITCLNDSDPLSDEERDFWSSGCFRGVASEIDTSFRDNVTIARSGIVPYLRSQKADDERKIHEDIIAGRHLNDEFAGITNCIINEKYYSDERFLVGEALTEELKHGSGYIIISNGFIDGNGLESYEIEYTFGAAGDMVDIDKILLYPVRHDGMTTANRCIVYGDRNGIVEPQFLERKYSATENRIRAVVRSLNNDRHHNIHIDIRHSLQDETEIRTEEKQTKLAPDPQIQIRLMERRYR